MPALSPTMKKGTVVKWNYKIGDKIVSGKHKIAAIETDKSTAEWESNDDGYIAKFLIEEGKEVEVGYPVIVFAENKEDVNKFADFTATITTSTQEQPAQSSTAAPAEPKQVTQPDPKQTDPKQTDRIFASPLAKNMAKDQGINLREVKGSGPGGRIVKADINNFEKTVPISQLQHADYIDIPNTNIRKIIASRLTQSKQQIPHYYLTIDFCVDKLLKIRSDLNERANGKYKLSINDFVIKASALTLRKFPEVNSSWNETSIRRHNNVHINVAVNVANVGLFTPIVTNTDNRGLSDIANTVKDLGEKAKNGTLSPNDSQTGTFTISNLGMFGIKSFTAVINPPQACILAVGGIEKRVVPNEGNASEPFKVANFMHVTLSCDHRVVDGALGANWLKEFKAQMEDPLNMLL